MFDSREYVECKLTTPLQSGHTYHLHYYCSPAEIPSNTWNIVGVDKIGALFTSTQINQTANSLSAIPSISSPAGIAITDTANWTRVHGDYQATGGEEWLTMGHFYDGIPVNYSVIRPSASTYFLSYYYLDDVRLWDLAGPDSVHSTVICTPLPMTLYGQTGGYEFKWNTGDTLSSILINTPGMYWVRSWKDTSYYVDTFYVHINPLILHLPNDTAVCSGAPLTIAANHPYQGYFWSTGATTPAITVNQTGQFVLTVSDTCGIQKDTINVFYSPKLHLPTDTAICNGGSLPLLPTISTIHFSGIPALPLFPSL